MPMDRREREELDRYIMGDQPGLGDADDFGGPLQVGPDAEPDTVTQALAAQVSGMIAGGIAAEEKAILAPAPQTLEQKARTQLADMARESKKALADRAQALRALEHSIDEYPANLRNPLRATITNFYTEVFRDIEQHENVLHQLLGD